METKKVFPCSGAESTLHAHLCLVLQGTANLLTQSSATMVSLHTARQVPAASSPLHSGSLGSPIVSKTNAGPKALRNSLLPKHIGVLSARVVKYKVSKTAFPIF